jgi:hypothetical protein
MSKIFSNFFCKELNEFMLFMKPCSLFFLGLIIGSFVSCTDVINSSQSLLELGDDDNDEVDGVINSFNLL